MCNLCRERLTSWKKLLQRLQGLDMGNMLEENKCNNLPFLSWIDAGDDFKMWVQSCTMNATHLSLTYRIMCSHNIHCTKYHLFPVDQATLYIMLQNEANSCEEFLQFVYHGALCLARHLLMWSLKFKKFGYKWLRYHWFISLSLTVEEN